MTIFSPSPPVVWRTTRHSLGHVYGRPGPGPGSPTPHQRYKGCGFCYVILVLRLLLTNLLQLVSQLYDPANAGNPTKINFIQEHLQALQKGPHAWLIANDLLGSDDAGLRFFGALTFTVKINHDW